MKKLIHSFALVLCFSFLAATTANTQNMVRNMTACSFDLSVTFDNSGGCIQNNTTVFTVPPFSNTPIPIFDFQKPITIQGNYSGVVFDFCAFYVEDPCNGTQQVNSVNCPFACGPYTAVLAPNFGLVLF